MINGMPFREAACREQSVRVGDLLLLHGSASWPGLLMVLSVLSMVPIGGVGAALSVPLFVIALRWPRRAGRLLSAELSVPSRLLDMSLGAAWSGRCLRLLAWVYDTAHATTRRRLLPLRHPQTGPGWRIWIAAMAFLVLLPLPFGNLLPGLSLVLLGLGWIFKDGLVLMLSLISGVAAMGYLVLTVHVLQLMFESALAWWA